MVVTAAQAQAQNTVAGVIEHAIWEQLGEEEVTYSDLVTIQRDSAGTITALTTNTAAMNQLRAELIGVVLEALDGVDVSQIQIPLGSLVDLDLLWGLGPTMKVHAMTVGTVEGEFQSQFSSAGVNQTLHKIDLELTVPLTLMLPGGAVEAVCETQIHAALDCHCGAGAPDLFTKRGIGAHGMCPPPSPTVWGNRNKPHDSGGTLMDIQEEIQALRRELEQANYEYYVQDNPQHVGLRLRPQAPPAGGAGGGAPRAHHPRFPTQRVGGKPLESFTQVVHKVPLESLQDVFDYDELRQFDQRVKG